MADYELGGSALDWSMFFKQKRETLDWSSSQHLSYVADGMMVSKIIKLLKIGWNC